MKTTFVTFAATALAASLFSSAAATPVGSDGFAIPLNKRSDNDEHRQITRRDGTVNWEVMDAHVQRASGKYQRTGEIFRQKHGRRPLQRPPRSNTTCGEDEDENDSNLEARSDFQVLPRAAKLDKRQASTSRGARVPFRDRTSSSTAVAAASTTSLRFYPAPVSSSRRTTTTTSRRTTTTTTRAPTPFSTPLQTTSLATTQAPIATSVPQPSTTTTSVVPTAQPTTGALALTSFLNDALWAGGLTIGGQYFLIDFDTGSSDLWVPGTGCTSTACANKRKYTPSSSAVAIPSKQFSILYGDGSTTKGSVFTDTVAIAGLTATNQTFAAATTLSDSWTRDPQDGLMGMGYQALSQLRSPPVFQTLVTQQKTAASQFSFKLTSTSFGTSELYLGGMNSASYVAGTTEWAPVLAQAYWTVAGQVQVNGASVGGTFNAIIDTGTTLIVAPTSFASAFWAAVPNSQAYPSGGYYTFPCSSAPTVSFTFGGSTTRWPLSAFNLGRVSSGSTRCVGSLVGQDLGINGVIVGDNFLKNVVYATFDYANNRVGFSQQRQA
ncbi:hypothetical protein JCM6882_003148 [Rhodosporidiobolus microsporus]